MYEDPRPPQWLVTVRHVYSTPQAAERSLSGIRRSRQLLETVSPLRGVRESRQRDGALKPNPQTPRCSAGGLRNSFSAGVPTLPAHDPSGSFGIAAGRVSPSRRETTPDLRPTRSRASAPEIVPRALSLAPKHRMRKAVTCGNHRGLDRQGRKASELRSEP